MSEETKTEAQQPATEQAPAPDLTVQDLTAMKSIIDVASTRGAFKPNEMTTVGTVYSKLEAFLNAVQAQQEAAKAEATEAPTGE
jgi:hypothetical protein|tara:strand:- start:14153 stop:14404 length:252 start_codon:yes stop_codon:yes gene_type:complete